MAHGAEDLHSRPLASPVANDVITGITEHSDFSRIKKLALVFAGNAKGKLELAFFVKNLKKKDGTIEKSEFQLGTIHLRRQQNFTILDPCPPPVSSFYYYPSEKLVNFSPLLPYKMPTS